jgi:hypothetical protein
MLGFNELGMADSHSGIDPGLGNQLYRYASLKGIANVKGYNYCIPTNTLLSKFFKLSDVNYAFVDWPKYSGTDVASTFHYNQEFIKDCPDNVDIYGMFFSEKYFRHIAGEVREDLTFKDDVLATCLPIRNRFNTEVIGVQIRRGDYVGTMPICDIQYYLGAIADIDAAIGAELPVLIISNDPIWCLQNLSFNKDRFTFVVDSDLRMHSGDPGSLALQMALTYSLEDIEKYGNGNVAFVPDYGHSLCLLSLCNHFVISNSTFGIWGAWLAKSKGIVIRPSALWDDDGNSCRDYYPEGWVKKMGWMPSFQNLLPCYTVDKHNIKVTHSFRVGFFSCCSIRLYAAVRHFNLFGVLPDIDSSLQFSVYKDSGKRLEDITNQFFNTPLEVIIPCEVVNLFTSPEHENESSAHMEQVYNGFTEDFLRKDLQFHDYRKINYDKIGIFVKKYFDISEAVLKLRDTFTSKYKINPAETIAIYFRGSDKRFESDLPDYSEFNAKLTQVSRQFPNHKILVQSDESAFYRFIERNHRIISISECLKLVASKESTDGLHHIVPDGMKTTQAQIFLAICLIISKCDKVILNSSNVSLWITFFRGNADDIHQYNNGRWQD